MPLHTDTHALHSRLGAIHQDAVYKGAILAAAMLVLLTAWF